MRLYNINPKQPVSKTTTANRLLQAVIDNNLMSGGEHGYFAYYHSDSISKRMAIFVDRGGERTTAAFLDSNGALAIDDRAVPPKTAQRYRFSVMDIPIYSGAPLNITAIDHYVTHDESGLQVSSIDVFHLMERLREELDSDKLDPWEREVTVAAMHTGLYLKNVMYNRPDQLLVAANGECYSREIPANLADLRSQPFQHEAHKYFKVKGYEVMTYEVREACHGIATIAAAASVLHTNTPLPDEGISGILESMIAPNEPVWWQPRLGDFVKLREGDDDSLYVLSEYRGTDDDWVIVAAYDKDDHKPPYYVSLSDIKPYFVLNRGY